MPNGPYFLLFYLGIESIRTMPAIAFTTVTSFQVILLCKYTISFFGKIVITLLQRNVFLHNGKFSVLRGLRASNII